MKIECFWYQCTSVFVNVKKIVRFVMFITYQSISPHGSYFPWVFITTKLLKDVHS